jgi:hypothetical protein
LFTLFLLATFRLAVPMLPARCAAGRLRVLHFLGLLLGSVIFVLGCATCHRHIFTLVCLMFPLLWSPGYWALLLRSSTHLTALKCALVSAFLKVLLSAGRTARRLRRIVFTRLTFVLGMTRASLGGRCRSSWRQIFVLLAFAFAMLGSG